MYCFFREGLVSNPKVQATALLDVTERGYFYVIYVHITGIQAGSPHSYNGWKLLALTHLHNGKTKY